MQFRRKEPSKHGPYKHQERSIPQQEPLKHLPLPSANQLAWILFQDEAKLSEAHQFLRKHLLRDKDVQSMLENTTLFKETFQQRKLMALFSRMSQIQAKSNPMLPKRFGQPCNG
ncbi:MAG: hypothetical protein ACRCYY_07885 [Trueperaceae bacterium]